MGGARPYLMFPGPVNRTAASSFQVVSGFVYQLERIEYLSMVGMGALRFRDHDSDEQLPVFDQKGPVDQAHLELSDREGDAALLPGPSTERHLLRADDGPLQVVCGFLGQIVQV